MNRMQKKSVLAISSHVARGTVGNRASAFALEILQFPVWSVPTVILPWHPGHGISTRIIPEAKQFSAFLHDIKRAKWVGEIGGILTGYMANEEQVYDVASLISALKKNAPEIIYVCDPVLGDTGGLYVPDATAAAIRDHLIPLCDIATPNKFELEWLTGKHSLTNANEEVAAARTLGPKEVLVTSASAFMKNNIANLLVSEKLALMAEHRLIANAPNGTGDLIAAVFLAHKLSGLTNEQNLQRTSASVFEILASAANRGSDELMLETDSGSLIRPAAMVQTRNLI
ncbi:MAG: pyridoxal kinase PdxY [Rhizobiaceae bacterium]|nr:pyridoxal kinase PdxY [Rhizobiaceae bacterium]